MTKEELKQYLIDEAEFSEERVEKMGPFDLVDHWLKYNGIIGYTDDILEVVNAAYGLDSLLD